MRVEFLEAKITDYYQFAGHWSRYLIFVVLMRRLRGCDEFLEGVEFLSGPAADVGRLTVTAQPVITTLSVRRLPQTRR